MGDIVRRGSAWYVRYKDADGTRRMRASHQPTRELARRYLLEIEARVARGVVGIPEPAPAAPTVAEVAERFLLEYSRPRLKDLDHYRRIARIALRRGLPFLGELRADAVQPAHFDKLRATLSKTHAAASVRHSMAFLSTMFGWAVKAGIVTTNPLRGVEKPTAVASLEYLSRAEVRTLLALARQRAEAGTAADRCTYAAIHLVLHVGLRRGELLGLRFQDVDVDTKRLTVARSFQTTPKSGKARHLRLPELAIPVLSTWLAEVPRHLGVVFPMLNWSAPRLGTDGDLLGLPELLAAAGCRPMLRPWHSLRHTFASHFVMSGGNLLVLQQILGHSDVKQTLQYAHLAPDFLGGEIDKLRF